MTRRLLGLLRQPEPVLLVAVFVVVLGILAFARIADEVGERDTDRFDDLVLKGLRRADKPAELVGPPWVAHVARDLSGLGGTPVLILVTATVAGFLLIAGNRRMMWLVLLAPASGALMVSVLKAFFGRPRPDVVPYLDTVSSYSFPSGHSMLAAVVYLTLGALLAGMLSGRRVKVYVLAAATLVTVLVGFSRVLLGVHYPTDVLGGWIAGLVWATLWWVGGRYAARWGRDPARQGE